MAYKNKPKKKKPKPKKCEAVDRYLIELLTKGAEYVGASR